MSPSTGTSTSTRTSADVRRPDARAGRVDLGSREALLACAAAVIAYFGGVFAGLEVVRDRVHDVVAASAGSLQATELTEPVRDPTMRVLAEHPVVGAGFVAAPDLLADRRLYLAWWQGEERTLLADERGVPVADHVFDYTRHEWWRRPCATGVRHVTGPYVDYVCSDEHVLTATAPVVVGGRVVGVVGADTTLARFERLLLPVLRPAGAVLVNDHDRCVVASDPGVFSGDRVDPGGYDHEAPCGDLPLRVLG